MAVPLFHRLRDYNKRSYGELPRLRFDRGWREYGRFKNDKGAHSSRGGVEGALVCNCNKNRHGPGQCVARHDEEPDKNGEEESRETVCASQE